MARLRIFIPKEELLWGLEMFVLIVFCFVFKDEGTNPIHLFVFSSFPITEPGKYPKEKKKKKENCIMWKKKRGENPQTPLSDYSIAKHTNISQKCFAAILKSNCKLRKFN